MTQEKLAERVSKAVEGIPRPSYGSAVDAAITRIVRAELQKAKKIAEDHIWPSPADKQDSAQNLVSKSIAEKIDKLME